MKTKRFVSTLLALLLICSLPLSAFAEEYVEKGQTKEENPLNNCIQGNDGTVKVNNGLVVHNHGTVEENNFKVDYNFSNGTVGTNNSTGTVTTNEGTVTTNEGTVTTNEGTVNSNGTISNHENAIVDTNTGTVANNYGTVANNGTISNHENAIVDTNTGTVANNYGTVTYNHKTVTNNNGTVLDNGGTVETNGGIVVANHSTLKTNNGTVLYNPGTVEINNGIVNNTVGTVRTNNTTGIVNEGTVRTNYGTVKLDDNTWYGVLVDNDGTKTLEQHCTPGQKLDFSQLTKEGYVYAGYTQAYGMENGKVTLLPSPITVNETSYTVTCPNVLTLIWQAIVIPGSGENTAAAGETAAAADDGAGYFGPGSHIAINGRQYLLVAVVEDVYCLASIDSFEDEQLSDLPALLASLLTEEQLSHVTGDPELLDEALTARFFAGEGSHIVFPCDSSLIFS